MWLDEDVQAALEWADYRASLCTGCKQPKAESMDPERDGTYEVIPLQCFACAAREAEARHASELRGGDTYGSGAFDGLYFAVTEREPEG